VLFRSITHIYFQLSLSCYIFDVTYSKQFRKMHSKCINEVDVEFGVIDNPIPNLSECKSVAPNILL
jgi:hypothetical protein